ncbi:MAG: thioredoxin fold domain-containing protein [Desulfosarcina sp.]|nr:thioredoxin fold domain-containing protein [Desulfobacterales bacterium]
MKKLKLLIPILIVSFCLTASLAMAGAKQKASSRIKWHNYKEGIALAQKQNKQVYLHFYTTWCEYCKEMQSTTLRNPSVVKMLNTDFIAIRVNTAKNHKVAARYNIRPVPDNWFLSSNGSKLRNFLGYYEPDQFVTILRYVNDTLVSKK